MLVVVGNCAMFADVCWLLRVVSWLMYGVNCCVLCFVDDCVLFVVRCGCSVFLVCCSLFGGVRNVMLVGGCLLFVRRCCWLLLVVRWLVVVGCCLLDVVGCCC